jgi:hypothetical protein
LNVSDILKVEKYKVVARDESGACNLCLTEKLIILTANQNTMLNRKNELLETCRHQRKHLLVSLFRGVDNGDAGGDRAPLEFGGSEKEAKPDFCLSEFSYCSKHLWI